MNLLQPVYVRATLDALSRAVIPEADVRAKLQEELLETAAKNGHSISPPNYIYWYADPDPDRNALILTAVLTADVTLPAELLGGEKDGERVDPPYDKWRPAPKITMTSVNGQKLAYHRAGLRPHDLRWVYQYTERPAPAAPDAAN